jgi:hypothetical protein
MKAQEVLNALRKRHDYDARQWVFFEEFRVGTGGRKTWSRTGYDIDNPEQRLDAYAMNMYESQKFHTIAYEIKVSRSDFLHEIRNPLKRAQGLKLSNYFYFVTPKGLVKPEEIPPETGLIEVNDDLTSRVKVKAPYRETEPPTWKFVAALARRVVQKEWEKQW